MQNEGNKTLGIISIVCGGVAIVCSFTTYLTILGIAAGIVGLILSVKAKKSFQDAGQTSPLPTVGLVLSIVGLVLSVIFFFTCTLCAICLCASGDALQTAADSGQLESALNELSSALG